MSQTVKRTISASPRSDGQTGGLCFGASVVSAFVAIGIAIAIQFRHIFAWLGTTWVHDPDYSHGFLVPLFSAGLLWIRRERFPGQSGLVTGSAFATGVALLVLSAATQVAGVYTRTLTLEAVSLLPCISGVLMCWGGWAAARWAWPSVVFLAFMFPLPGVFSGLMSETLQRVATIGSTIALQLIGLPAISEGNVIWLSEASIGVAEACSGLRMLVSFFALTVGACFVIQRPLWEKVIIVLSAPLIAVFANVVRITSTGIAFDFGNKELAERIFHDLAGWLMMPLGLAVLYVELAILSAMFLPNLENERLVGMSFASDDKSSSKIRS